MRAVLAVSLALAWQGAGACELNWPDPEIAVPAEVARFIRAECSAARGTSEETEEDCVRAEGFGYRAQVMLLTDAAVGDIMAARYRECRGGLGTIGGKFHRHRADCMGGAISIIWRFEFTRETHLHDGRPVDFARLNVGAPHAASVAPEG